jgi:hypothetical protein
MSALPSCVFNIINRKVKERQQVARQVEKTSRSRTCLFLNIGSFGTIRVSVHNGCILHQDIELFPSINAAQLPDSLQRNLIFRPAPDKLATTHTHDRQTYQAVLLSLLELGAVSIEPGHHSAWAVVFIMQIGKRIYRIDVSQRFKVRLR